MENEEISTASGGGAGANPEQQDAGSQSQDSSQGQSTEPSQVESGSQASSNRDQARSNSNWANQRLIEKAVQKVLSSALDAKLAPLIERFNQPAQNPPASQTKDEIDYNDLSGSINKLIEARLQQRLDESLGKTIPKLREELTGNLRSTSKLQEARNYLISQPDIGQDQSKHDEIQHIIAEDELLYNSLDKSPLKVIQEAVKRWKSTKVNPNVPSKDQLSTVNGMAGQRRGGEPSVQRLRELQAKVVSNLPTDEREKLNREIDAMMSVLK